METKCFFFFKLMRSIIVFEISLKSMELDVLTSETFLWALALVCYWHLFMLRYIQFYKAFISQYQSDFNIRIKLKKCPSALLIS